jgi:hypothetical protein
MKMKSTDRPIQETKVKCPCCNTSTRIARLTTFEGESFQLYLRNLPATNPRALSAR